MDTPTIAKYYREKDPMERLKLLEQSIAAGAVSYTHLTLPTT